jgi:hypothetical protein
MKLSIKIVVACPLARRNPVAASLCSGQFRKQTVRNPKLYTRKGRKSQAAGDE